MFPLLLLSTGVNGQASRRATDAQFLKKWEKLKQDIHRDPEKYRETARKHPEVWNKLLRRAEVVEARQHGPDPKFTKKLSKLNKKMKTDPAKVKEFERRYPEEWEEFKILVEEWSGKKKYTFSSILSEKWGATSGTKSKRERREELVCLFLHS